MNLNEMHDKVETNDINVHEGEAMVQHVSSTSEVSFSEGQVTPHDMVELGREDASQGNCQGIKAISESAHEIDATSRCDVNSFGGSVLEGQATQHDVVEVENATQSHPQDVNSFGVSVLNGQETQHDVVEVENATQSDQQDFNAVHESVDEVDATQLHDGNVSGEGVLEGQAMQHDIVEDEKESLPQRNEQELNGQLVDCSIKKDGLIEAVHKFLQVRHQNESRPVPVFLGGKEVDLLGLCLQVRACGGYDKATSTLMWSGISEILGFGRECGAPLKLVYVKYLKALESWSLLTSQEKDVLHHLSATKMSHLVSKNAEQSYTDNLHGGSSIQGSKRGRKRIDRETPSKRKGHPLFKEGDAKNQSLTEQSMLMYDGTESLAGLLEWLKRLALNPGDPRKGQGPRGSKQNEAWVGKCVATASKLRAILWKGKGGVPSGRPPGSRGRFKKN